MTTSKRYTEAYVWVWLPNKTEPIVAGKLTENNDQLVFNYGKSFLELDHRISLYEPELPLRPGELPLLPGLSMPGCIRDASPDAWGRRVLIHRNLNLKGHEIHSTEMSELSFLLESGSDRIGALDFQTSPTQYAPRNASPATLDELVHAAEKIESGTPLTPELEQALYHGSSIGGARPKALIDDVKNKKKWIAKFSSGTDIYNVIKAEFVAMRLASSAGLSVANVRLEKSAHKDVLLIERFDRKHLEKNQWKREMMVSALTLFSLDEMMARYASYETLTEIIRSRFKNTSKDLNELFKRLVFNILCGNTDDHARNHAAFWNGQELSLTPAYDICPQLRSGGEASQGMLIEGENRMSQITTCLKAAKHFQLSQAQALEIIEEMTITITKRWDEVCEEASLSPLDRKLLANQQFLNPYAFEGLDNQGTSLIQLLNEFKSKWAK